MFGKGVLIYVDSVSIVSGKIILKFAFGIRFEKMEVCRVEYGIYRPIEERKKNSGRVLGGRGLEDCGTPKA